MYGANTARIGAQSLFHRYVPTCTLTWSFLWRLISAAFSSSLGMTASGRLLIVGRVLCFYLFTKYLEEMSKRKRNKKRKRSEQLELP